MKRELLPVAELIRLYEEERLNAAEIGRRFGVSRQAVRERARRRPDSLADIEEEVVDAAEHGMLSLLASENEAIRFRTAEFILKTKGRGRGYVYKVENPGPEANFARPGMDMPVTKPSRKFVQTKVVIPKIVSLVNILDAIQISGALPIPVDLAEFGIRVPLFKKVDQRIEALKDRLV